MAGASDIRAGGAFVELSTKDSKFHAGIKSAEAKFKAFGSSLMAVGGEIVGAGVGIGAGLYEMAKHSAEAGAQLLEMSERTGIGVETLSKFQHAAGQAGIAAEDLETSIGKMQKNLANDDSVKMFGKWGLSLGALRQMKPEEQFATIADAIAKLPPGFMQSGAAMDIFGKSGRQMLPLLKEGKEGIQAMMEEAERLGLVMSTEDAEAAHRMSQQMKTLSEIMTKAAHVIGSALFPALIAMNNMDIGSHGNWLKMLEANKGIVVVAAMAAAGFIALGAAVFTAGAAMYVFGAALGYAKIALRSLIAAVLLFHVIMSSPLTGPLLILGAILAGTVAIFWNSFKGIGQAIKELAAEFGLAWEGIRNALARGDLGLAASIGMKIVQLEWVKLTNVMADAWRQFVDDIADYLPRKLIAGSINATFKANELAIKARGLGVGDPAELARNEHMREFMLNQAMEEIENKHDDPVKNKAAVEAQAKAAKDLADARAAFNAALAQQPQGPNMGGKPPGPGGAVPDVGKLGAMSTFGGELSELIFGTGAGGGVQQQQLVVAKQQVAAVNKVHEVNIKMFGVDQEMLKAFKESRDNIKAVFGP